MTTKKRQKISEVLINTPKEVIKITGDLAKFDSSGKIVGYCALGVLACKKKLIKRPEDNAYPYSKILREYGIRSKREAMLLANYIWKMNDKEGASIQDIGFALRMMGY